MKRREKELQNNARMSFDSWLQNFNQTSQRLLY